jgi:hypothetical protein
MRIRGRTPRLAALTVALFVVSTGCGSSSGVQVSAGIPPRLVGPASHAFAGRVVSASPAGERAASCSATQLSGSAGQSGPAAGTEISVLLLHNISAKPCWLGGLFPLSASVRDAPPVSLHFRASADPALTLMPPTSTGPGPVAPGGYGAFIVTECLADECIQHTPHYTTLDIQIAPGHVVVMPYPPALAMGRPGTEGVAEPVPSATGILGH